MANASHTTAAHSGTGQSGSPSGNSSSGRTIVARFDTRREAELALEHLVQQHKVPRADVFLQAPGEANSAGTRAAGADVESGHPGVAKSGRPELAGAIELSVDLRGPADPSVIEAALREVGAKHLQTR